MYDNDSHSPSPKGADRYPKVGEGKNMYTYQGLLNTVYRQWCMTCLVCQRLGGENNWKIGRKDVWERWTLKDLWEWAQVVHSLKSLLSPCYSLPESSHHRSRYNQVDKCYGQLTSASPTLTTSMVTQMVYR